jgi:hypothetical protein
LVLGPTAQLLGPSDVAAGDQSYNRSSSRLLKVSDCAAFRDYITYCANAFSVDGIDAVINVGRATEEKVVLYKSRDDADLLELGKRLTCVRRVYVLYCYSSTTRVAVPVIHASVREQIPSPPPPPPLSSLSLSLPSPPPLLALSLRKGTTMPRAKTSFFSRRTQRTWFSLRRKTP